jgi:hypothetical protein
MHTRLTFFLVVGTTLWVPLACSSSNSSGRGLGQDGSPAVGIGGETGASGGKAGGASAGAGGTTTDVGDVALGGISAGGGAGGSAGAQTGGAGGGAGAQTAGVGGKGGSRTGGAGGSQDASYSGTVHYVATDGSDSGDGSVARPWATFAHAFGQMRGGDTLLIKDGVYHEAITSYYDEGFPSGSPGGYTLIKAEHDWQVTVYGRLRVAGQDKSYFQIEGIQFMQATEDLIVHHVKFIRCSFRGDLCTDNNAVVNIGAGSSYVLFEDCFTYGCGRYKFLIYGDENGRTENVILRRCVSRHDFHDPTSSWGQQCATFTSYTAHNFVMQNCISIDSGNVDPMKYGFMYGGAWFENKENTAQDNTMQIQDSIFFNLAGGAAITDPHANGDRLIENSVVWNSQGGYLGDVAGGRPNLLLNHMTIDNIWGTFGDESHAWGTGAAADSSYASAAITNSLITHCDSFGIANHLTSEHNDYWANAVNFGSSNGVPVPTAGAHDVTVDPVLHYLFRAEAGSPAKSAGSDGKDLGASIMYRRGVSGTLYGDPGWDQLTSEPLWPFPNEDVIKTTMSAWDGKNDARRGFCASGNGLYGGPVTLTSYLWEALGSPCPTDICPR